MNFDKDIISGFFTNGPVEIICNARGIPEQFCIFTDSKQNKGTAEHPKYTYTVVIGVNNGYDVTWERQLFPQTLLSDLYEYGQIELLDHDDDCDGHDDDDCDHGDCDHGDGRDGDCDHGDGRDGDLGDCDGHGDRDGHVSKRQKIHP